MLGRAGIKVLFDGGIVTLSKNEIFVGKGYDNDGLFVLNVDQVINENGLSSYAYLVDSIDVWHGRLGHLNLGYIKKMKECGIINSLGEANMEKCEICAETKITKKSCKSVTRESELLSLVHSDLGDLKHTMTRGGKNFYVIFVDDHSRFTKVYLLRTKDEVLEMFMKYKNEVENQKNKMIKRLRTDRGGEYKFNSFKEFCEQNGIIHEANPPYSPESNRIVERKNRTLKEMMNAMLVSSGLSSNMWGEAILSACHIQNKVPHKKIGKTPYELWKRRKPNLEYLKVWGCLAKVMLLEPKKRKLGSWTCDCVFIEYASNSSCYRFLVIKSDILESYTIIESENAIFFENLFPLKNKEKLHESIDTSNELVDDVQELRSKRARKEKSYGNDFLAYIVEDELVSYYDAIKSIDAPFWLEAINSELDSIMFNYTWKLVELPPKVKPIGYKWIFKRKLKPDDTIDKYKAR